MIVPQASAALAGRDGANPVTLARAPTMPPPPDAESGERTRDAENRLQAGPEGLTCDETGTGPAHIDEGSLTQPSEMPASEWRAFLAPAESQDEIGRLGPYRILKFLGAGAMGVVFQAEDPALKRKLAIKAMLPALAASASARQRFLREAQSAAAIEHDHIVAIHQVGEERGLPYLVMPLLKGEPLDARLKRTPALPIEEVMQIGWEMASGLAAAHAVGLIHRDIKPANTWLEAGAGSAPHSYRVKILDFGLARAASGNTELTQQGAIVGTPAYMAPEQAAGQPLDGRCDLFSLGCVLYRASTGRSAFAGSNTMAVLVSVTMDNPPPPQELRPELPRGLSDLVMQLLAKKPEDRPQSAEAVMQAFMEMEARTQELPAQVAQYRKAERRKRAARTSGQAPERRWRSPRWLVAAGGLICLAIATAGTVVLWPTPQGTVRIETDDPDVEIVFDKSGPTIKGADKQPITLRPGEHGITVQRGDFSFETGKLVLKKGDAVTLRVELLKGDIQVLRDGKVLGKASLSVLPAKSWGQIVDPDGDCQFLPSGNRYVIGLPGTPHGLTKFNVPRVLQEVTGDFAVQVKVGGDFQATAGKAGELQAGGLLIGNKDAFIYLGRESWSRPGGQVVPRCATLWAGRSENATCKAMLDKLTQRRVDSVIRTEVTHVRLERRGDRFFPCYSADGGKTWQPHGFGPFAIDLPEKVNVGVVAINEALNSNSPLKVEFEDLQLTRIRPAPRRTLAGWGEVQDPDGNCEISADRGKLTIRVPNGYVDLSRERFNAPRVLQDVTGDFVLQVKVGGSYRATKSNTLEFLAGGLLMWDQNTTFVRLERASLCNAGASAVFQTCNLQGFRGGDELVDRENHKPVQWWWSPAAMSATEPLILRLVRRRDRFLPSLSIDGGKTWLPHAFGPFVVDFPEKLKVGVCAVNVAPNSANPLTFEFEDLRIRQLPPAPPRILKGWGEVDDPCEDCTITADQGKLAIEVPGSLHDFSSGAPRVLQEVEGDFVAQVSVPGNFQPREDSAIATNLQPWQSAGLVVWKDSGSHSRFERAYAVVNGKLMSYSYSAAVKNAKAVVGEYHEVPNQATILRLERRENRFIPSYSLDGGQTWLSKPFEPYVVDLPSKVKVGVAAVNTTINGFKAELEDLQIKRLRQP
jgi:serine/threonine protein kinase/regulation of enolase protein 1 (concanavalin A-like superfamily)